MSPRGDAAAFGGDGRVHIAGHVDPDGGQHRHVVCRPQDCSPNRAAAACILTGSCVVGDRPSVNAGAPDGERREATFYTLAFLARAIAVTVDYRAVCGPGLWSTPDPAQAIRHYRWYGASRTYGFAP